MPAITRPVLRAAAALTIALGCASRAGAQTVVTERDITYMTGKLHMAADFFEATWRQMSRQLDLPYGTPYLQAYRGTVRIDGCGGAHGIGAFYCPARNTIYYDEVWLAGEMRRAGAVVGTDGDVGAIVVIAHEWGHAMHAHWGLAVDGLRQGPDAMADCFAGAVLRESDRAGQLERGDVQEAEAGLRAAGDDDNTGHHGVGWLRVERFRRGFGGGSAACVALLRQMSN